MKNTADISSGSTTGGIHQNSSRNANISGNVSDSTLIAGDGNTLNFFARNPSGIPLQRPEPVAHFRDRKKELEQLLKDLKPGCVITLCGPGGIGKTAITSRAVWELAPADKAPESFPDGIIFYTFYGRPDVNLAFDHIVRSFEDQPQDTSCKKLKSSAHAKAERD